MLLRMFCLRISLSWPHFAEHLLVFFQLICTSIRESNQWMLPDNKCLIPSMYLMYVSVTCNG